MAITSGFFDSVSGDRRYFSDFFSSFLQAINGNGIGDVVADFSFTNTGTNMVSTIGEGEGIINGRFILNDANFNLVHNTADPTNDRVDRIILRLNLDTSIRAIDIVISEGTPAATPLPPALVRAGNIYELSLYQVLVPAASAVIPQGNQTDERADTTLCGQIFYRGRLIETIAQGNSALITALRNDVGVLTNLTTSATTNLVAAINEVDNNTDNNTGNIGTLTNLTTTAQNNLVAAINEIDAEVGGNIGDLTTLTTTAKNNLVSAINEVDGNTDTNATNITTLDTNQGSLASLTTTNKTNFVGAINEVDANTDTNTGNITTNTTAIGTLTNLTTTNRTDLVVAVNEVDGNTDTNTTSIGTLANLNTTDKTSTVNAINEVNNKIIIAPTDIGRFDSSFELSDATFTNTQLVDETLQLSTTNNLLALAFNASTVIGGSTGVGQGFNSTATANLDTILEVRVRIIGSLGTPVRLRVTLYDATAASILYSVIILDADLSFGQVIIRPPNPVAFTRGNVLHVRVDQSGAGNTSNGYNIARNSTSSLGNSTLITTTDLWSTTNTVSAEDLNIEVYGLTNALTGSTVKNFSLANFRSWGNIKLDASNLSTAVRSTLLVRDESLTTTYVNSPLANGENLFSLLTVPDTVDTLNVNIAQERDAVTDNNPDIVFGGITAESNNAERVLQREFEYIKTVVVQKLITSITETFDRIKYRGVKIYCHNLISSSATNRNLLLTLDGVTTNTYDYVYMRTGSTTNVSSTNQSSINVGNQILMRTPANSTQVRGGFAEIFVNLDTTSVSFVSGITYGGTLMYQGIGTLLTVLDASQITLTPSANDIGFGSTFEFWGLPRERVEI